MKKLVKEWKGAAVIAFLTLVFAFALRIVNLTRLPVFADEAIYIRWSQVMAAESTLRFLPLSDGKQPLFMWILMTFVDKLSDPLFAGRIVSVMSGVGAIVGIFSLTYLLFKSKKAALIAAFIWAISPFSVFFDRLALVDSMLAMWGVWTAFFAVMTAKYRRIDTALFAGFCLGFAWLTKSPALFFVLLIPTTWLFADWNKKHLLKTVLSLLGLYAVTTILGFAMYNLLRLGPNFHLIASRNLDYVYPMSHLFQSPLDPFRPHFDRVLEWIRILGPFYVLLFAIFSFVSKNVSNQKNRLIMLAWFLLPVLANSEFAKVLTARYILLSLPFLAVLAGSAFAENRFFSMKFLYAVLAVFAVHSLAINYLFFTDIEAAPLPRSERSGYLEEWTAGTGIKQVADFIKDKHTANPDMQIVVGTEGYFGTLPDGLQIYLQGVPNVTVIGTGLDFGEVPQSLVDSKKAGNTTYFVANSSRLKFRKPFEEYGLKVIMQIKKADRPDGIREYVQHGPYDTFYLFELVR